MKHLDSVRAGVRKQLAALSAQTDRLRRVLSALDSLSSSSSSEKKPAKNGKRTRRVRYKVTCLRCGKPFTAKRTPKGTNPFRSPKFCHKPCTSGLYYREQRKERSATAIRRGTTLLPGDPLSAAASH